jgi:hypothetical protein
VRADVLRVRTDVHRRRLQHDRMRGQATSTIHQARDAVANSRRSCHFSLDWHEPDESLDLVLIVHEH